jgi:hypothetical protein
LDCDRHASEGIKEAPLGVGRSIDLEILRKTFERVQ